MCLIAGYAACLHEDIRCARQIVGNVPIIAVNAAAKEVKALLLFSQHPDRFKSMRWIEKQLLLYGKGFTVHSRVDLNIPSVAPWIDYWWSIKGGGGSAWHARKVASFIGFNTVILCGCPMEPGPYVGNHNIGGFMHRQDVVDDLCNYIKQDKDWHNGVYSMSGKTRLWFGEPC